MLENLIKLVTEHAGDAIINNPAIPNEHNNAAIETTASSIMDALKGQMGGGQGLNMITQLFQGGSAQASQNPITSGIANVVADNLSKKLGIPQGIAATVVAQLLPKVMNGLVNKTNDPNDKDFDLTDILSTLGGGGQQQQQGGGILNTLKGLFGG